MSDARRVPIAVQTYICGGPGRLSDDAKAELEHFANYLRLGGKRAWGSLQAFEEAEARRAAREGGNT